MTRAAKLVNARKLTTHYARSVIWPPKRLGGPAKTHTWIAARRDALCVCSGRAETDLDAARSEAQLWAIT